MQQIITPYSERIEPWVYWENGFTKEELDVLQEHAKQAVNNAVVGEGEYREDVRRTRVVWGSNNSDSQWFFSKMAHIAASLNSKYYKFSITGFGEMAQFGNYTSSDQGTYNWHQDFSAETSRKLSLILQLSNPNEYEGGNLEIMGAQAPKKERGLVIAFPAWTQHRVTPVIKGSRQTVVLWASGEPFR